MTKFPLSDEYATNLGWGAVLALTLWMFLHTQPALWLQTSWPSGGDIASHLLYVAAFQKWFLEQGKISGWLPEVFAGFPALTYYFPLPFALMALLSLLVGLPLAFKWLVLLPAFLLPATLYWSGGQMGWPPAARLLGSTATVGFLVNESHSIWGGNLLAQFSGEFAYSWGLWLGVLFWGVLARLRQQGGRGSFLALLLVEVATAMSHGFAILMLGFGSLCYGMLAGGGWRLGWLLLRLHLLAFLLASFWLLPLLANHAWTIPNDALYPDHRWLKEWWPPTFWWLLAGLPPLASAWLRAGALRLAWLPFLAMGLTGLAGTLLASQWGLANIRFLPYAQLGFSLLLAAALGWWLSEGRWLRGTQHPQQWAMNVALLVTLGVVGHWEQGMRNIPDWSSTFFAGYEGRSQWPVYRQLADQLRGSLADPRILFEHDPANHDLGSTRALEALPFFGSRPVLEGLFMESAISAPFIYQLQAEVSQHPSGPLNRYPPQRGSVTAAVNHMRELGADTLLLRSEAMKARFGKDDRFYTEAEIGPLQILRLTGGSAPLLELLSVPLHSRPRSDWLDYAYNRFLTDHPYRSRSLFVEAGESLPEMRTDCQGGNPRLEILERERLVIHTDRPGCPHLLRMSYHPKWRALSGEHIGLLEPFFMLVVPRQERLELVYQADGADRLGWGLTGLGGVAVLFLLLGWRGDAHAASQAEVAQGRLGWLLVGGILLWGWYGQQERDRAFQSGHLHFDQQQYAAAADLFDRSVQDPHRSGWVLRGEALFWAGLAWERAGHVEKAQARYQSLQTEYPAAPFAPESLYRLFLIEKNQGNTGAAKAFLEQLAARYPESEWLARGQAQWE
ncbi:MAG: tetratricopeptide repeat protein [Magnetococcales bacterium]|nr:tetratricopeptide repeat protein [Magnetococcales bacterium]